LFDRTNREDAAAAVRAAVEKQFPVVQTSRNRHHFTMVLPKPVTDEVAERFNILFGRLGGA
jgi:hypothetical protein